MAFRVLLYDMFYPFTTPFLENLIINKGLMFELYSSTLLLYQIRLLIATGYWKKDKDRNQSSTRTCGR
jgi:hypothetical protein